MVDWQFRCMFFCDCTRDCLKMCTNVTLFVIMASIFQMFQEEIQGKGMCLEFIETVNRETIETDSRRTALTIQASTARVILIFCWYTDVKKIFLELAKRNVSKSFNAIVYLLIFCGNKVLYFLP